jgi:hypothetical protein
MCVQSESMDKLHVLSDVQKHSMKTIHKHYLNDFKTKAKRGANLMAYLHRRHLPGPDQDFVQELRQVARGHPKDLEVCLPRPLTETPAEELTNAFNESDPEPFDDDGDEDPLQHNPPELRPVSEEAVQKTPAKPRPQRPHKRPRSPDPHPSTSSGPSDVEEQHPITPSHKKIRKSCDEVWVQLGTSRPTGLVKAMTPVSNVLKPGAESVEEAIRRNARGTPVRSKPLQTSPMDAKKVVQKYCSDFLKKLPSPDKSLIPVTSKILGAPDPRLAPGFLSTALDKYGAKPVEEFNFPTLVKSGIPGTLEYFTLLGQQRDWALLCELRVFFSMDLFDCADKTGGTEIAPYRWTVEERGLLYSFFHEDYDKIKEDVFGNLWSHLDSKRSGAKPSVSNYKNKFPLDRFARNFKLSSRVPDFVKDMVLRSDWRESDKPALQGKFGELFRSLMKSLFEHRRFLPVLASGHGLREGDGWTQPMSVTAEKAQYYVVQRITRMGWDPDVVLKGYEGYSSNMKNLA